MFQLIHRQIIHVAHQGVLVWYLTARMEHLRYADQMAGLWWCARLITIPCAIVEGLGQTEYIRLVIITHTSET